MAALHDVFRTVLLDSHLDGLSGLSRHTLDPCVQNQLNTFVFKEMAQAAFLNMST
jgi:hypothetical protein